MEGGNSRDSAATNELEAVLEPLLLRYARSLGEYYRHLNEQPLTKRQRETALLSAAGLSNEDMAGLLYVSKNTVKTHYRKAGGKLGRDPRRVFSSIQKRNWNSPRRADPA